MDILGIRIDNFTQKEIIEKIVFFFSEEKLHQVATVNPEFILEAQKNELSREILNSCDLNVADGFGISCAFLRYGKMLKARIPGADLVHEILRIADQKKMGVFLAINKDGLSGFQEIKDAISKTYPNIAVSSADLDRNDTKYQLPDSAGSILFCNFGHPQQEAFINSQKCGNIRLAMGVGGSFDYLTGKVKRAPIFMQRLGLEWLFRLIRQPKRIGRIWRAVVVFPIRIVLNK
ncbi:MAG: WecB/TagA/CpsF family glycosyltransferase [Candidatus Moranbacteria bacterium]|nr:WecB/TagA/CpsF family glycosyltransferase [Candidatus Moranbacteria bacterium]